MTPPLTGQRVGRFQCGELLASGGMAHVYEAEHVASDQVAVVKLLRDEHAHDRELRARLTREIDALVAVRSRYVPQLYDSGLVNGAIPYLTIERCVGPTLRHELRERARLPVDEVVALGRQLAGALDAIHSAGYVHRDVKPGNLILHRESDGTTTLQLIDFGICAPIPIGGVRTTLSDATSTVGTPAYMAPEQARALPPHEASDIFSAGVVLFEMLTGSTPFEQPGEAPARTMRAVVSSPAPPVRRLRPDCPEWLADAIARALAKPISERIASAAELGRALSGPQEAHAARAAGAATPEGDTSIVSRLLGVLATLG